MAETSETPEEQFPLVVRNLIKSSTTGKLGASAWRDVEDATKRGELKDGSSLNVILRLILETIVVELNRETRQRVEEVIFCLAEASPAFASRFLKIIEKSDKKLDGLFGSVKFSFAFSVLCYSCAALRSASALKARALDGVLSLQFRLLSVLEEAKRNFRLSGFGFYRLMFLRNPRVFPAVMRVLASSASNYTLSTACGLCMEYLNSNRSLYSFSDYRKVFLKTYMDGVMSSAVLVPSWVHGHFEAVLRTVTHEEFSRDVLPVIERMLKRSPETVLPVLLGTFSHVSIDLSLYAAAPLAQSLVISLTTARHENKDTLGMIQDSAVKAISALLLQVSDPSVFVEVGKIVLNLLNGRLPFVHQRVAVVRALASFALSDSIGRSSFLELGESIVSSLVRFISEEAQSVSVLEQSAEAIAGTCARMQVIPDAFVAYAKNTLKARKEKDEGRRNVLMCLVVVMENADTIVPFEPLLEELLDVLQWTARRTAVAGEAAMASYILVRMCMMDPALDDKLREMWKSVLLSESGFLSPSGSKLLCRERSFVLRGFVEVMTMFPGTGDLVLNRAGLSSVGRVVLEVLVYVLSLPGEADQKKGRVLVARIAPVMSAFCETIVKVVIDMVADSRLYQGSRGGCRSLQLMAPLFERSPSSAALWVLAAHLPLFDASSGGRMKRKWAVRSSGIVSVMAKDLMAVCKTLGGSDGLSCTDRMESVMAARRSFAVLVSVFGERWLDVAVPFILDSAAVSRLDEISEGEVILFLKYEKDDVDNAASVEMPKSSKYMTEEDVEWERLRAEVARRKRVKESGGRHEGGPKREVDKHAAEVRQKVKDIRDPILAAAESVSMIVTSSPSVFVASLHGLRLGAIVFRLLKNQLTREGAEQLLAVLVSQSPAPLNDRVLKYLTVRSVSSLFSSSSFECSLEDAQTIRSVSACVSRIRPVLDHALPLSSFVLLFPVLRAAMMAPELSSLRLDAVKLIRIHASAIGSGTSVGITAVRSEVVPEILGLIGREENSALVCEATELVTEIARYAPCADSSVVVAPFVSGLFSESSNVRLASLRSVDALRHLEPSSGILKYLFLARFDEKESNCALARTLGTRVAKSRQFFDVSFIPFLLEVLMRAEQHSREAAGRAIASGLGIAQSELRVVHSRLFVMFADHAENPPRTAGDDASANVANDVYRGRVRKAVAYALERVACVSTREELQMVFAFFTSHGLGDPDAAVRRQIIDAGLAYISALGAENVEMLLAFLDHQLSLPATTAYDDLIHEGVVIFLGAAARHCATADDPRVVQAVHRLVEALKIPSESVQEAVAKCLPPLIKKAAAAGGSRGIDSAVEVEKLMAMLLSPASSFGERRGAAHGLGAFVKGLGIGALPKFKLMPRLQQAVEDKDHATARLGALFAYECLCLVIGPAFEPYVVIILPLLLVCFGDSTPEVRGATEDVARVVMKQLGPHGIKMVLPALLQGLDDRQWRTKQGSVKLLGNMAYLAPAQLSSSLPTIVPRLSMILTDAHPKVREAANEALEKIGSVISNPEVQDLVPMLLKALSDPNNQTKAALEHLSRTEFVHLIDAPSLALIMPSVQRGLRERSTSLLRTRAAEIVGSICVLADAKDVEPYVSGLLVTVKGLLLDAIPECRAAASKALASLVVGLIGSKGFDDLVSWLRRVMLTSQGQLERHGAAQGLTAVMAAAKDQGEAFLVTTLDDVLSPEVAQSKNAIERDGVVSLILFLPNALGARCVSYLGRLLPVVLEGLADSSEFVRDTSMRAGRALVRSYAEVALSMLVSALEEGLFDENWRIRFSSINLMGELLFQLSGVSGNIQTNASEDEDEGISTSAHGEAILGAMGRESRDRVLSMIYMMRSDVTITVRQSALHVWKSVVANTPRVLREIMPVMIKLMISCLGSENADKQHFASRTIGDLAKKLGPSAIKEILPLLGSGLGDSESAMRTGVCLGLSELASASSRESVREMLSEIVPFTLIALGDDTDAVREQGAQVFDVLVRLIGKEAVNAVLESLLSRAYHATDEIERAQVLDGLKQIVLVRAVSVLPVLVPQLVSRPLSSVTQEDFDLALEQFHAGAFASIAPAMKGTSLTPFVNKVLASFIPSLCFVQQKLQEGVAENESGWYGEFRDALRSALFSLVASLNEDGGQLFLREMTRLSGDPPKGVIVRALVGDLLIEFCGGSVELVEPQVDTIFDLVIRLLCDSDKSVAVSAWGAMNALCKAIPKAELSTHLDIIRDSLRLYAPQTGNNTTIVPGFCLPRGIAPLVPVFVQALLFGSSDLREQAALGLGDIVSRTSPTALGPFVIAIVGPLIRVVSDRFSVQIKVAILSCFDLLLVRGGRSLRQVVPQLQSTLVKSLQDSNVLVRQGAASAMEKLFDLLPHFDSTAIMIRVEGLAGELLNAVRKSESGVVVSLLGVVEKLFLFCVPYLSEKIQADIDSELIIAFASATEHIRLAASSALAVHAVVRMESGKEERNAERAPFHEPSMKVILSEDEGEDWRRRQGRAHALRRLLQMLVNRATSKGEGGPRVPPMETMARLAPTTLAFLEDEKVPIKEAAADVASSLLILDVQEGPTIAESRDLFSAILKGLVGCLSDSSMDVRVAGINGIRRWAKSIPVGSPVLTEAVREAIPAVLVCESDRNVRVRIAAERAVVSVLHLSETRKLQEVYANTLSRNESRVFSDFCGRLLTKYADEDEREEDK